MELEPPQKKEPGVSLCVMEHCIKKKNTKRKYKANTNNTINTNTDKDRMAQEERKRKKEINKTQ